MYLYILFNSGKGNRKTLIKNIFDETFFILGKEFGEDVKRIP